MTGRELLGWLLGAIQRPSEVGTASPAVLQQDSSVVLRGGMGELSGLEVLEGILSRMKDSAITSQHPVSQRRLASLAIHSDLRAN